MAIILPIVEAQSVFLWAAGCCSCCSAWRPRFWLRHPPKAHWSPCCFALGHGDSALAEIRTSAGDGKHGANLDFFGHKVNPTAVGHDREGRWYFGQRAIKQAVRLPFFAVGIKTNPLAPEWNEKGPLVQRFAAACFQEVKPHLRPEYKAMVRETGLVSAMFKMAVSKEDVLISVRELIVKKMLARAEEKDLMLQIKS